jgi:membrane associated rhomboid family serine protease
MERRIISNSGDERMDSGGSRVSAREPLISAPWPAVVLPVIFLAIYALQAFSGESDRIVETFAFQPAALLQGAYAELATSLFIHGNWPHVLFNSAFALAFGAPVARLFGTTPLRGLVYLIFFLVCGVLANLGYALVHMGDTERVAVVGASGGIAGFMGAASRLIRRRPDGGLAPFTSPTVVGMAAAWISGNVLIGLTGLAPMTGGAPIAWEAHLAGYAAGLFLIEPFARGFGRLS